MIIRSSRMQRTYSIAVATESTYYIRVCHIHTRFFYMFAGYLFLFFFFLFSFTNSAYLIVSFIPSHSFLVHTFSLSFYRALSSRLSLVHFFSFFSFLPNLSSMYTCSSTYVPTHTFVIFISQIVHDFYDTAMCSTKRYCNLSFI